MSRDPDPTVVLLVSCPDRPGLVAEITRFIHSHGGNVVDLEQHVDHEDAQFFMRVEWETEGFDVASEDIERLFRDEVAEGLGMSFELRDTSHVPRMAVFVSRYSHCLYDILSRAHSGEWRVEIPIVVSNHPDLTDIVQSMGIRYEYLPISSVNQAQQEAKQLELLEEHAVDFVVLARYMRILPSQFVARYANRIINIHHSFLPAFAGARPYHSAYERGVKIIGATSHYVTDELDAGPIIEQDVVHVRHTDNVSDMMRKGQDIEKIVLARAVWHHLQHHVLVHKNRTVVFGD